MSEAVGLETAESIAGSSAMDDLWTVETTRQAESVESATPAVDTAQADPVAEPDAPAEPAESDKPRDAAGQFTQKAKKPRNDPQARVEQATAREAAAKAEAASLRAEVEALRRQPAPVPRQQAQPDARSAPTGTPDNRYATRPMPTEDEIGTKYDGYAPFARDLARWEIETFMAERDAQAQQEATQREHQTLGTSYRQRAQAFATAQPDFQEALQRVADIAYTPAIERAILGSDRGPQLAYHLATHREDYAQLVQETQSLSADAAPMVRRFLESQVPMTAAASQTPDSARVTRPSAALPPVSRVGGTASATPINPDDLEFSPEYIRLENQREQKEREARRW